MTPLTSLIICILSLYLHLEVGGAHHRVGREEVLVDRAHVDVPALMLGRFASRQLAHRGHAGLHVGRDRAHHEGALERVDCHFRIRYRTVAIRQPVDVRAPQLAAAIIGIDVGLEPHFGIHVDHGAGIGRIDFRVPRHRLDHVHMPHLPVLRARAGAAVGGTLDLG
jgi:hypothetical protein